MTPITRLVPAVPQTLEELLEENDRYLNWLDSIGAEETRNNFVLCLEKAATPPEVYYYTPTGEVYHYAPLSYPTLLVEVGGVSLSPYTHRSKSAGSAADPLNLIFTGKARVDRVAEILMHELFPPELWRNTKIPVIYDCAETQWVYVDDGVQPKWQKMKHTLAVGGCALNRCHIRLFEGGYDEQLGDFTLANAHYERSYPNRIHVIEDWDNSQDFVRRLFESKPFCKKVREEQLQAQGEELQRVAHDGLASIIELQ